MILCKGCDQELPKEFFAVDKKRSTGRRYKCRACSAAEFKRWQQTPGYAKRLTREFEERAALKQTDPRRRWAAMALGNAKKRAKQRDLPFDITLDWLIEAATDRCPLLDIELKYDNTASLHDSAAVDRIDSARGYTPDNCWVVSMKANRIKSDATVAEIEAVAQAMRLMMDKGLLGSLVDKRQEIDKPPPKIIQNPYGQ
jgi:hypothetical protein